MTLTNYNKKSYLLVNLSQNLIYLQNLIQYLISNQVCTDDNSIINSLLYIMAVPILSIVIVHYNKQSTFLLCKAPPSSIYWCNKIKTSNSFVEMLAWNLLRCKLNRTSKFYIVFASIKYCVLLRWNYLSLSLTNKLPYLISLTKLSFIVVSWLAYHNLNRSLLISHLHNL